MAKFGHNRRYRAGYKAAILASLTSYYTSEFLIQPLSYRMSLKKIVQNLFKKVAKVIFFGKETASGNPEVAVLVGMC